MRIGASPLPKRIQLLAQRYPHLGPACWMLTIQYFVAQIAVAIATQSVYNWGTDAISVLGITACGMFEGSYVCSPLHAVFNLSLISLGVMMAVGALLIYHQFNKCLGTRVGFSAIVVAGLGSMLVGLFPANTIQPIHDLGSGLSFIGGLVGVFALSISLHGLPRQLRYVMLCYGFVALAGVVLLACIFFLELSCKGAAERISSYAEILWLITFGVYICACHGGGNRHSH